jgi:hypothetical protein
MKGKVNSAIRIPTTLDEFFRYWFDFLRPFHHLTEREIDVATALVKQRYNLSKVITDESILDKVVMSDDTRKKVREECQLSIPHFQVIMGKLKKNKIITDGRINPKFVPEIVEEDGNFQLLLLFEFK